jgi:hypothetical protein
MLGPNACGFSKMSDQTPLGSVSWAWLLVRPKRLWVWQDNRRNSFGLGYVLDPGAFGPRGMLDLTSLGLESSHTLTYNKGT